MRSRWRAKPHCLKAKYNPDPSSQCMKIHPNTVHSVLILILSALRLNLGRDRGLSCLVQATTAAQSLPCSRYTLAATPTPLRALSVSANALPALASLSAAGLPILPTQSSPPLDHLPAVTEDLVLPPWDPMAAHNEETPGLPCQEPAPLLLEKGGEDSIPVGNERRRPGVLALLRGVCRSLMGGRDDKARPREEVTALPVPRLEDDTPLLAWRQEVYVQSRLQDSPQLTIGEARVRTYIPVPAFLPPLLSHVGIMCAGLVSSHGTLPLSKH